MNELKQTQKGGDNSVQNQIGTQIIVGIDEKRVREICDEKIALAVNDYSFEAQAIARQRIDALTEKVVERLRKDPSKIQVFSDPSFQRDVVSAQIAAAESDREADIETIAELLFARMTEDDKYKRPTKTSIRKAIAIVPELSADELAVLTVMFFLKIHSLVDMSAVNVEQYLKEFDAYLLTILSTSKLPYGGTWRQRLSLLDCIEVNHVDSFATLEDYFLEDLDGLVCVGIAKDSSEYLESIKILDEYGITHDALVTNVLLPEYVRLPFVCLYYLSKLPELMLNGQKSVSLALSKKQEEGLRKIVSLYKKDDALLKNAKQMFLKTMNNYGAIQQLRCWLASQEHSFELTLIGETLAYVNLRRCIPGLPDCVIE